MSQYYSYSKFNSGRELRKYQKYASLVLSIFVVVSFGCSSENQSLNTRDPSSANKTEDLSSQSTMSPNEKIVDDLRYLSSQPLNQTAVTGDSSLFTEVPGSETGIDFANVLKPENLKKYLLNGAGLCSGDYDNDGMVDLYLVCQDGPNKLYRQIDDWKFEDVTASAGNLDGGDHWGRGAAFADIENDGDIDLYVCNVDGPNQLFLNQGDGTFKEDDTRGVSHPGATTMAAFADYDRDGDLDIYLVNNRLFTVGEESPDVKTITKGGKTYVHPDFRDQVFVIEGRVQEAGQRDVLFNNDGKGNFTEVTDSAGINGYDMGLSATWWDFNDDGWLDIYVGNDFKMSDHLYRNNGDGTFTDVLSQVIPHTSWFSMGADAADLNGDGILDFMVADMSSTTHYKQKTTMGEMGRSAWFLTMGNPRQFMRNACYLSTGADRFMEVANITGLDSTDWTWSVKFGDYDNDSLTDVFVTNGYGKNDNDSDFQKQYKALLAARKIDEAGELFMAQPPLEENNIAFKNMGDLKFENVAPQWGLDHFGVSIGASSTDIDKDGDLDLVVSHLNEPISLYRNNSHDKNCLLVKLNGTISNRQGIGAKISVSAGGQTQVRQILSTRGYVSSDEPVAHFGLGDHSQIDMLTVNWPSGVTVEFTSLESNKYYTVIEPDEKIDSTNVASVAPANVNSKTRFKDDSVKHGVSFKHQEREFDDFEREPLLPNKLSRLGPGVAWADVNGDSLLDFFVGGAAGQAGVLYIQQRDLTFEVSRSTPWSAHAEREDMGTLFFDIDSDGDEDLFVVSGGVECQPNDELLRDRIYLNNGNGGFDISESNLIPDIRESGSSVAACDYDRDGDLDLFVGSRVIPGQWPLSPRSVLLRNDDGQMNDITDEIANGLANVGLVTGVIWSDMDGDGWNDLLLSTEWGPITVFKNDQGKFRDVSKSLGLTNDTGWFNGIASGDVDHDGDLDYVVTNFGLNTKYHATHEHPSQLFVSDFDEDGRLDLVEAEWEGETCYPIRGRSCSSHAMPFIKEKFESYHEFGLAELNEIYTSDALEQSTRFAATRLESVLVVNNGSEKWEIKNLPRLAQTSPGFGVVMTDLDSDGNIDIYFAQNFMDPQPETGQMDGGVSAFLRGDGRGNFEFVYPSETGLVVSGQGMSVTTMDVNRDARPDIAVSTNNGPVSLYLNQSSNGRPLSVSLVGDIGNNRAFGSRITFVTNGGTSFSAEIQSGNGYLSQSSGELFVSFHDKDFPVLARIVWYDGNATEHEIDGKQSRVVIKREKNNKEF